jgi:hypothetical protein
MMVKPSYILHMIYPMTIVIMKIHRPAMVMSALRSMFLVVCDTEGRRMKLGQRRGVIYFSILLVSWDIVQS